MKIDLVKYNRHWQSDFTYPYPIKRNSFKKLQTLLYIKQIVGLLGLRRTGKSTIIFQLINHLINNKVNKFNILYFSFDEFQISIDELLKIFESFTKVNYRKEKIFIFLDEIQKLENFQTQIKVYYDLYPNIKFILTGSTSFFIKKKTRESLAGRVFLENIGPLKFEEYLRFINKENILGKPLIYKDKINKLFDKYLKEQFIDCIFLKSDFERKEYLNSIIKKIIYEDLPSVIAVDYPSVLYRIVQYIAQYPGAIINNIHLAEEVGISNKTVSLYLEYLEEIFLIKKVYNFSRNLTSSQKRLKKYYLSSVSLLDALVDFANPGNVFENYYISLNDETYFFQDPEKHEVDFIDVKNNKIVPIEIKNKTEINKIDCKGIIYFMKKYQLKNGVIIYKGFEDKNIVVNDYKIKLKSFLYL